jgi:hypothetical protein
MTTKHTKSQHRNITLVSVDITVLWKGTSLERRKKKAKNSKMKPQNAEMSKEDETTSLSNRNTQPQSKNRTKQTKKRRKKTEDSEQKAQDSADSIHHTLFLNFEITGRIQLFKNTTKTEKRFCFGTEPTELSRLYLAF